VAAQIYQQLQQQVVSSQPADRQAQLSVSLQRLMAEVQRNLEPKNRDKFTQVPYSCRSLLMRSVLWLRGVASPMLPRPGTWLPIAAALLSARPRSAVVSLKGNHSHIALHMQNLTAVRHDFRLKI